MLPCVHAVHVRSVRFHFNIADPMSYPSWTLEGLETDRTVRPPRLFILLLLLPHFLCPSSILRVAPGISQLTSVKPNGDIRTYKHIQTHPPPHFLFIRLLIFNCWIIKIQKGKMELGRTDMEIKNPTSTLPDLTVYCSAEEESTTITKSVEEKILEWMKWNPLSVAELWIPSFYWSVETFGWLSWSRWTTMTTTTRVKWCNVSNWVNSNSDNCFEIIPTPSLFVTLLEYSVVPIPWALLDNPAMTKGRPHIHYIYKPPTHTLFNVIPNKTRTGIRDVGLKSECIVGHGRRWDKEWRLALL